jgi:hypothetical protein
MPILTSIQITNQSYGMVDALRADGDVFAESLASQLSSAITAITAFAVGSAASSWPATYPPTAAAADRASRFACTQIPIDDSTLLAPSLAAFGVGPLGTPTPIAIDTTPAVQAQVAARVSAALALAAQQGPTPIGGVWTSANIGAWVTAENTAFVAQWALRPPNGDPAQDGNYLQALAAFNSAVSAASAYLSTARFQ